MSGEDSKIPSCFGQLDKVFPMGERQMRETPESCFPCPHKTLCLKTAMQGADGLKMVEERVDRAYERGMLTFWERWSQKKKLANTRDFIKKQEKKRRK